MKVLQINSVCGHGSTGTIAVGIAEALEQKGHQCYIAYGLGSTTFHNGFSFGNKIEYYIHNLLFTRILGLHGYGSYFSTKKLVKYIETINPDIIHLHNIHGNYLNYIVLFRYLKCKKIPIVWTLHDCWSFTGHCAHYTIAKCDKWKSICSACPQKNSYPPSLFFDTSKHCYLKKKKYFGQTSDITIVPVSTWLKNQVENSFLSIHRIYLIYNGINTSLFKPVPISNLKFRKKYNLEGQFIAVACATAWSYKKGLLDYIKLSKLLDHNYSIVLVGLTTQQINLLPSSIIGIERTNNVYELIDIYASADVVLNLSYEETFGMTTIEGMACGTPSIVYNATASPELVDERTGYVVEKGDVNSIKTKIEEIKEKGKSYFSQHCIERVNHLFNQTIQYNKYIDLYNNILNNK